MAIIQVGDYMKEQILLLEKWIGEANHIVFFGGAGVSTESGIPDFRSKDGLYSLNYPVSPETILSHRYFYQNTKEFFRFYRDKMNSTIYKPNSTHYFLTKLEKVGSLQCIITQNIDGLHTKAGSENVLELHGSIYHNHCTQCNTFYTEKNIFESKDEIPTCICGGIIKPDVVLYGETLDTNVWKQATKHIQKADLLIVGGTSLTVYPASDLIHYFKGKNLVIINNDPSNHDDKADLVFHSKLSDIFSTIKISEKR